MYNQFKAGMLTGSEIKALVKNGTIEIDPFDDSCINPNSYNLKLHPQLKVYDLSTENNYLDSMKDNKVKEFIIDERGFVLKPGILYIGRTIERTHTDLYIPMLDGRSSGGRLGLNVHICAGFGDIGFNGTWTLEITVVHPLKIYPNMEIAQVSFFTPHGHIENLYNNKYQNQIDATPSKMWHDREEK